MPLQQKIFNAEMNQAVVHENLRWFLASRRQGTHSALTRAEVSGGGAKPWKQKGTGRARAGSNRSPIWRKGGVIFPPKPRAYGYALPKKVRVLGLKVALSDFNRADRIKIVDRFVLTEPKAKAGAKYLTELKMEGEILIVMSEKDPSFERGVRNLAGVKLTLAKDLNIFDLLKSGWVLMDKKAVAQLEERLS
jgi:large subunit ribosomal protein L4